LRYPSAGCINFGLTFPEKVIEVVNLNLPVVVYKDVIVKVKRTLKRELMQST